MLSVRTSTAIAFEIFEIFEMTKFWTLRAFEGLKARSFRNCRILILITYSSLAILKPSKFRQLGDYDSVERSEISTSNARRFRRCPTYGDFHVERSQISLVQKLRMVRAF